MKALKLCERVDAWRSHTKLTTVTCGSFQLYFNENLFFTDENSKLHNWKELTNTALETLLNELFTLNPENNEKRINEYTKQRQINMKWLTLTYMTYSGLSKIVDFGYVQPLQWKNNEHWKDWRNIFSVKAKLVYEK